MGNLILALVFAVSLTVLRFAAGVTHDYLSGVHEVVDGYTRAVVSWDVQTPGGSWIETYVRAKIGDHWTTWYSVGQWSHDLGSGHRRSVRQPGDGDGHVDTDTLLLERAATAWQARVSFHSGSSGVTPALSLLAVTTDRQVSNTDVSSDKRAWATDLNVPQATQHVDESSGAFGGGGEAWCSPTSVSMVMAYWAERSHHPQWAIKVPKAAAGTYDPVYDGCGNWPFNVAFASEHGLQGWVERLAGLDDIERYIASGVPIIASIKVEPGELDGSPYKKTDGHLLVVRGFTADGDVIANDPAGRPGHIRIIYKRVQFNHVWMGGSKGIVYVIGPPAVLHGLR